MEKDEKELKDLLLDIDVLNELDKWTNEINFFEISGMTNQEIKHSKTLAWLLDPNENHLINDQFLRRFIQKIVTRNTMLKKDINIFDVSLLDYGSFIVKREWKNIDIFIYSEELKICFAIENKVYAPESKDQLNEYFKIIKAEFKDYKKMFIYLTREGEEPSDPVNWCIADYKMIVESLEETLNTNISIGSKTKLIINDYISIIRRNFGMDNELKRTAHKIYLKHKRAFDLIFEVVSNTSTQFTEHIKIWIEENKDKFNLIYDESRSTNTMVRFITPFIEEMFPFDEEKGDGWKSGNSFMYEIYVAKDGIRIWGMLSHFERPNSKLFMDYNKRSSSRSWRVVMPIKVIMTEEEMVEGITSETIKKLHSSLNNAITSYIRNFENNIKKQSQERKS